MRKKKKQSKSFDIFLNLARIIGCGYNVHVRTDVPKMYVLEQNERNRYTSVHQVHLIKLGFNGVSISRTFSSCHGNQPLH